MAATVSFEEMLVVDKSDSRVIAYKDLLESKTLCVTEMKKYFETHPEMLHARWRNEMHHGVSPRDPCRKTFKETWVSCLTYLCDQYYERKHGAYCQTKLLHFLLLQGCESVEMVKEMKGFYCLHPNRTRMIEEFQKTGKIRVLGLFEEKHGIKYD